MSFDIKKNESSKTINNNESKWQCLQEGSVAEAKNMPGIH